MSILQLQNGSDIRGIAMEGVVSEKVNLTPSIVGKIAYAFAKWIENKTRKQNLIITIGRDSRLSGKDLVNASSSSIASLGHMVYNCGLSSTPSMFMSTIINNIDADGAIMITASHLPFNRNGMKFFTKEGGLNKKDITEILTLAEKIDVPDSVGVEVKQLDLISVYSEILVNEIRKKTGMELPFKDSKIIVDAGNGAGGFFVDKVLKPLGADTTGSLYLEPDGNFPNHEPNPENKKAMNVIQEAVLNTKADLGIIFDTDVDRGAVVDKSGKIINRNALVALMSSIILERYPNTTIVTDSVTSSGLKTFIENNLGGKHHRFKRGYRNVINEAVRLNKEGTECHLAIETSGHCAVKDNYFLDDGAYLVTLILIKFAELKKQGKSLTDLISTLKEPLEAEEIRIKINSDDFISYGQNVIEKFIEYINSVEGWSLETPNYEGVRVICDKSSGNGWCLMRLSLHDPVLPINFESDEKGGCKKIKNMLLKYLSRYDKLILE